MTSHTIPIYRNGRKFYVSAEEYERICSEERQFRHTAVLRSQQIPVSKSQSTPVRSPSTNSYNPIKSTTSNQYDYKYCVLKTRHLSVNNSSINTNNQQESNRLSRSTLKHYEDRDNLSTITPTIPRKKPSTNIRSHSSDKILDNRKIVSSISKIDDEIKRSLSAENTQEQSPVQQQKSKQQTQIPSRRPIPTIVSDYGISPTTTFSMTPTNQSLMQTNSSKLTNYFARMKQSTLNTPAKTTSLSNSATSSLIETSMQGFDHVYTVMGSTNRRSGDSSSSFFPSSITDNSKTEYLYRDTTSGSLSDENSSSLSTIFQRRNTNKNYAGRPDYADEREDIQSQQRDSWTRSTMRSQSSDGTTEKKRVRFADMEDLTLETVPNKNKLRAAKANRLLTRRQHTNVSSDTRDKKKPINNAIFQVTTKICESKLATDV
ncbi:unnamed protein product [Rotaria magnacalcarata]|uniref:Uncharacterized protein n=2 Tax=Rotaria magnacalcarata TaxID=392030 RepID=A0A815FPB0_9BILA|nr:unnamed protein product [Rotaria magnacalcarata]